jgi:hypothetical protein
MRLTTRIVSIILAGLMIPVPALAQVDEEPATAVDGHPPDDPEEGHDHGDDDFESSVDGGTLTPFFNESAGCDDPAGVATPMSTTNSTADRNLPSGHQVRGPWGAFYGRDHGDVSSSMVSWTVPMSGGKSVAVHRRALPAFQKVAANLAAEQAKGNFYNVRIVGSWVWRRIGGSYRMSIHSFGAAIDINWDVNLYSDDNELHTDLPSWFVKAWTDAGFCWGGDWLTTKDAMHFSWKGPLATPGYGTVPLPYTRKTAQAKFTQAAFTGGTTFRAVEPSLHHAFADGNRDGAPDVFRVRPYAEDDLIVEYVRSSKDFQRCGLSQAVIPGAQGEPGELLVADHDGDGRPDIWRIDTSGAEIGLHIRTYARQYRNGIELTVPAAPPPKADYGTADYDRDGLPDLYVVSGKSDTRVRVWSGASNYRKRLLNATTELPSTARHSRWRFSLAFYDSDGIPDLVAIRIDGSVRLMVLAGADRYRGAVKQRTTGAPADRGGVYGMADYDGDGRPDLMSMTSDGTVRAHLGGVQSGSVDFWFQEAGWRCDGAGSMVPWDVDGDRIADLVVGVPDDEVASVTDAGLINVLYGTPSGPGTGDDELWHQDSADVGSSAEAGDRFGSSMTWGDFDGDGIGDLAVGAPNDGVDAVVAGGVVNVMYGTTSGLTGTGSQLWYQDVAGVEGTAQARDHFGKAVAAGDFNGDGWDDLAVGVPGDLGDAGVVNVLYGSKTGLTATGDHLWYQDAPGVPGVSQKGDQFGAALAVGYFNGDRYADLAVGAPGDTINGAKRAGVVIVLHGSASGLRGEGSQAWSQNSKGILGKARAGDRFGASVASGDFDGNGRDDLAVGVPGERVAARPGAGAVNIVFGRPSGLWAGGDELWHQDKAGIPGVARRNDRLGSSVAAGDVDSDGFHDLAIGVPGERAGGAGGAGAAVTMFGGKDGLTTNGVVLWRQGFGALGATSEKEDRFGAALRFADLDGDGHDDLVVALPGEDLNVVDAGAVVVIYSNGRRLVGGTYQVWHQDGAGVAGEAGAGDHFGSL